MKLTEPIRVKPDTGYCLRIWAKRDERGLTRVRICDPAGRAIALCDNGCGYEMTAYSSEFDWKELPLGFRTGQHDQILLELEAKGASRSVWFDDIEFVEDDSIRVGDVTPIEPALEFSAAEKERGYVVFSRHYLERTFQTSVPKPEEITNGVRCRASLDEYEPISVMVRSLKNLTALNAQIREPLVGPQGATIPASEIDVRMVRPSRRWLNSVGYVELPLFLPLAVPDDLPADQTRQFWITVHVPEDAVPGLYRGVIEIFAKNAPARSVALEVDVVPIRLLTPPVAFGMYYNVGRIAQHYRGPRYQRMYLEDIKTHGMTSVTTYNGYPTPRDSEKSGFLPFGKEMELLREIGLPAKGIPLLYLGRFSGKGWGPRKLEKKREEAGWPEFLYYVSDEPSSPEAIEAAKKSLARFQGLSVRTVTAGLPVEELGRLYDVWIQKRPAVETQRRAKEWGKELWAYDCRLKGATPIHDRYICGLLTWEQKLGGQWQWAYVHFEDRYVTPEGEWKGTESWRYGYVMPSAQGPIPTVGWEGRREGIDDYKYLYTLHAMATKARRSEVSANRAAGAEGLVLLKRIEARVRSNAYEQCPPDLLTYSVDFVAQPELKPEDYDQMRKQVTDHIVALQELGVFLQR